MFSASVGITMSMIHGGNSTSYWFASCLHLGNMWPHNTALSGPSSPPVFLALHPLVNKWCAVRRGIFHIEHRRPWGQALIAREKLEVRGLVRISARWTSAAVGWALVSKCTRDAKQHPVKRALQIFLYLMLKQTAIITGHYLAVLEHLRLG